MTPGFRVLADDHPVSRRAAAYAETHSVDVRTSFWVSSLITLYLDIGIPRHPRVEWTLSEDEMRFFVCLGDECELYLARRGLSAPPP